MPLLDAEPHVAASSDASSGDHRHPSAHIENGSNGNVRSREHGDLLTFESNKKEHDLGFASPISGTLVLANTLLGGSGMLGIPHAMAVAGWALGLILIFFFGCCSAFGSHLLHCAARRIGSAPSSFYSVASAVVPNWTWLIDGAVMVKCFGVGTSYLIIVGDLAPDALHYFGLNGVQRWHAIVAGFALGGILACQRNLSALRYTAFVSVLIVAWTAILIVLFFFRLSEDFDPCTVRSPSAVGAALDSIGATGESAMDLAAAAEVLLEKSEALPCYHAEFRPVAAHNFIKLGKALPVFIFGFTCQQNVFTVINEVREASRRRVDGMIMASYSFSGLAFAASAFLSYATYGHRLDSDLLKSYPQSGPVQFTRLLFALLAIFSFPLQVHPSRNSFMALWEMVRGPPGGQLQEDQADADLRSGHSRAERRSERRRFWTCTIILLVLALVVALSVKSLGTILGVVGATGSTMVSYILPGLVYVGAFKEGGLERALAFVQLGLGCVIMPTCLCMIFL